MSIPYSEEGEAACLGAMILAPEARAQALDMLGSDDFHVPYHRRVFDAVAKLAEHGSPCDPLIVAETLGCTLHDVVQITKQTPGLPRTSHLVGVVAELGALRRTLALADDLRAAVEERDTETIDGLLTNPMAAVMPHHEPVDDPIEASVLALEETAPSMLLAGLQARVEVPMWVGEPGFGKSTLLRQIAVCAASGVHPFTMNPMNRLRVLIVDCQESRAKAGREISKLLAIAGPMYQGTLWVDPMPQGIDLSERRWQRWLDAKVARVDADLVILGPLYNMVRGAAGRSKHSEETAELAMNALNDLMVARNVGLMIEAHAPHGQEMRVRGSKLWEDWPDFGFGLASVSKEPRKMNVEKFRGDRHDGRRWPNQYEQGEPGDWPWVGRR